MSELKNNGVFFNRCILYFGEYYLSTDLNAHVVNSKETNSIDVLNRNVEKEGTLRGNTIRTKEENEEHNDEDSIVKGVIFHGNGKYIKRDEMFCGRFENNQYRSGLWMKYKNIHNLFFYMRMHEMLLKENKGSNELLAESIDPFKHFLFIPLKEVNIYLGEFENNMFNGLGIYYVHPFLYIGYFLDNQMNGYGYMFYIPSIQKGNVSQLNNDHTNVLFREKNLSRFLFKDSKRKDEIKSMLKLQEKEKDSVVDNTTIKKDHTNLDYSFFREIYEKLKKLREDKYTLDGNTKETIKSSTEKRKDIRIIDKLEKEIYNNFKLRIRKSKKIKKLKEFFNEYKGEGLGVQENFLDIFNCITYSNLIFKGFFYQNRFSTKSSLQLLHKEKFIQLYERKIVDRIEEIKNDILKNIQPMISQVVPNETNKSQTVQTSIDDKDTNLGFVNPSNAHNESDEMSKSGLQISKECEFYLIEKKKSVSLNKKKEDIKCNDIPEDPKKTELKEEQEFPKELKYEYLKDVINWDLLKTLLELTTKNSVEYFIRVVTNEKIIKYKNHFQELKTESNKIRQATINLNGYHQLVIIIIKCKNEISLNTVKGTFLNVSKIKLFLISSNTSSIIQYNSFNLYYILVYVKNLEKKNKAKIVKKKK